ncbi:MAG: sigma-70 family RNA polymerase sigma factor [Gemmataceae bacterium]
MINDNIVLDRFAQDIIRRKARLLVGRAGLTKQDREDLEQELALRLLQSLEQFDQEQGHLNVFITTVIERAISMILRARRAKKRDAGVVRSLDRTMDGTSAEPTCRQSDAQELLDLANDLAETIAIMPENLRDLAERLKTQSVSQTARDLGIPRSTLQGEIRRLRQIFENTGLQIYL